MTDDKQVAAMRAAFEAFIQSAPKYHTRTFDHLKRDHLGEYETPMIWGCFEGWKAATGQWMPIETR